MTENFADRRQFGRRTVFKAATMVQANGSRTEGTVLDLSEGGARIKIGNSAPVGQEFYLEIPEDDFVVKCRVARMNETFLGVEFIRAPRRLSWARK